VVLAVHRHNQIGLADVPHVFRREFTSGRQNRRVALDRAAIDPRGDGRDFFVVERDIVLVLSNADGLSRCHGGISRFETRSLIERAHGRASS